MKIVLAALFLIMSTAAIADTYVKGYVKKNGTYVQPHMKSAPDSSKYNNYSTQGNLNPYNGKQGTVEPYSYNPQPTYQNAQPSQYNGFENLND